MDASKLPPEILLEEILPRLPAKSLLRFKCVCKSFQTLISTPQFIHRHLRHCLSSDADRLLILAGRHGGVYSYHLDSSEFPTARLPLRRNIKDGSCDGPSLIGSCNGLVCISTPLPSLIIFNPSTGSNKEIIHGRNRSLLGSGTKYGFGFDDINDDYKVVRLTSAYPIDLDLYKFEAIRGVEVYSFRSGYWDLIEGPYNQDLMMRTENGALIDNHLVHWRFWSVSYGRFRIGCFDLRNNRWSDVPLPVNYLGNGSDCGGVGHCGDHSDELIILVYFGVLDECLCLLTENLNRMGEYDLWVMKEYGVKESWVKLVSISLADVHLRTQISPLAYAKGSRNELLIVRKDSKSKIFWYNIRDKTCRLADIHGVAPYSMVCICKGSLVGIPRCLFSNGA